MQHIITVLYTLHMYTCTVQWKVTVSISASHYVLKPFSSFQASLVNYTKTGSYTWYYQNIYRQKLLKQITDKQLMKSNMCGYTTVSQTHIMLENMWQGLVCIMRSQLNNNIASYVLCGKITIKAFNMCACVVIC